MAGKAIDLFAGSVTGKVVDFLSERTHEYINLEKNMKKLEKKIEELDHQASDVVTTVVYAELCPGKKRKREVEEWLKEVPKKKIEVVNLKEQVQQARYNPLSRVQLAQCADTMMEDISGLIQQRGNFGELWLDVDEAKGVPLIEIEWRAPSFKRNLREIWAQLMNEVITSIGICGMGGVGKTTLAKFIHNDLLEETTFSGQVYWVTASQEASIHKLQNDIAKAIKLDLSDEDDEMKRAAKLLQALKRRGKFVILVDDVWTDFDAEKMGIPLQGSKLIVTSRSVEVCRKMGCKMQIKVKPLCQEETWELFKRKLGRREELPSDVKEIAMSMAEKCVGLPLAVATVAGSMKGADDIYEWKDALDDLEQCSVGEDDAVFKILEYSYNRLRDQKLKNCFLFCSLYPEDYNIERDKLITLFISEGLIDKRSRQAEFDCGHTILNKLENACLLEGGDYYENVKYVKMHDLIRDMALKITKSGKPKYMVKAGIGLKDIPEEGEWKEDLVKVSLTHNHIRLIPLLDKSPKCPKLTTLILRQNDLSSISDSFFTHLGNLQTLDLSFNRGLKELPDCTSDMKNLKALLLRLCEELTLVPPLGNLEALRELDLYGTKIKEVPKGLERLIKLRRLNMANTNLGNIPDGMLSELRSLRSLQIPYGVNVRAEELEALKDLEEFRGRFSEVDDLNHFVRSRQSHVGPNFYFIKVLPDSAPGHLHYSEDEFYDHWRMRQRKVALDVLDLGGGNSEVLLPEDIEDLEIKGINWSNESLSELILIQSGSLTNCRIDCIKGIKWILKLTSSSNSFFSSSTDKAVGGGIVVEAEEGQIGISPCAPLQRLESLSLYNLPDLLGLLEWESAVADATLPPPTFSRLKTLKIHDCPLVTKLFTPKLLLRHLQNLEEISVFFCHGVEEIITAEDEETSGVDQYSQSPRTNPSVVPKLKKLYLLGLPKLRSIYKGTLICDSIETIWIWRCSNLKRMPLFLPTINGQLSPPPALWEIKVSGREKEWWESLEWENPQSHSVLQPFVRYHN